MTTKDTAAPAPVGTMLAGRRADSARRRQRVLKTLNEAASHGEEISVSGIARRAGVDRSFLYRHRDLLAAQQRCGRMATRAQQLERRLSELLGEQTWRESGLGAPDDIDQLNQRITHLEQQIVDLRLQLDERDQDLDAARAANRDLMTQLNASQK